MFAAQLAEVPALARAQHEAAAELVLGQVALHQQDAVAAGQRDPACLVRLRSDVDQAWQLGAGQRPAGGDLRLGAVRERDASDNPVQAASEFMVSGGATSPLLRIA